MKPLKEPFQYQKRLPFSSGGPKVSGMRQRAGREHARKKRMLEFAVDWVHFESYLTGKRLYATGETVA